MPKSPEIAQLLAELEANRGNLAVSKRLRGKLRKLGHFRGLQSQPGSVGEKPKYTKGHKPENIWARALCQRIQTDLASAAPSGFTLRVSDSRMLPYAQPVLECEECDGETRWLATKPLSFATDIILELHGSSGKWIPAVVIECKLGSFDTHNVLAYAAKARSHRSVFPALRYGVLLGKWPGGITGKLARHGESFDFMITWPAETPTEREWSQLLSILRQELEGAAVLRGLAAQGKKEKSKVRWIHRRLLAE